MYVFVELRVLARQSQRKDINVRVLFVRVIPGNVIITNTVRVALVQVLPGTVLHFCVLVVSSYPVYPVYTVPVHKILTYKSVPV